MKTAKTAKIAKTGLHIFRVEVYARVAGTSVREFLRHETYATKSRALAVEAAARANPKNEIR
jgi:hypothetical protein